LTDSNWVLPATPVAFVAERDRRRTALFAAGALLDVELLDHLAVGQGHWVSLRRLGLGFPPAG
jgi:hypothetical protein